MDKQEHTRLHSIILLVRLMHEQAAFNPTEVGRTYERLMVELIELDDLHHYGGTGS